MSLLSSPFCFCKHKHEWKEFYWEVVVPSKRMGNNNKTCTIVAKRKEKQHEVH